MVQKKMIGMKIEISHFKNKVEIIEDNHIIASFKNTSWTSYAVEMEWENGIISVTPRNIWSSKFDIIKHGVDMGDIVFNWNGQIVIELDSDLVSDDRAWILKKKKFWQRTYYLTSDHEVDVLSVRPSFSFSKTTYHVQFLQPSTPSLTELVLYVAYGIWVLRRKESSVG